MKKSLLALAALTTIAGVASAQSSVTISGVVDVNMRYVDNDVAGKVYSLSSGGMNTSRLAFRGIEDLGGGLRAGFWIEAGFAPDTGLGQATGNTFGFNRRATASLIGGFGEVRLGRDEHATYKIRGYEYFNTNGVATGYNMIQTFGTPVDRVRNDNMVAYILPAMGGVFGQVQVAAGENSTTATPKYYGGIVGYGSGPFRVAGSYGKWEATKNRTMVDDLDTWIVAGEWNFGFMKVMGIYEETSYGNRKQKVASLPISAKLGPGTIKAQYSESGGDVSVDAKMFGIGYVYDMSKRTALYTSYGSIDNSGTARFSVAATNGTGGANPIIRNDQKSSGYEFGVRHFF